MASKTYTQSERGGGNGDTGRMRAAILNQINSWWRQAVWVDEDKADQLHAKLNETPERFISPNPDANYREEASRIYGELKADYSLRQESDLNSLTNEYEARADAHYAQRETLPEPPENELGGAPEPTEPEPADADPFAGSTDEPATADIGQTTAYPGVLGSVRLFADYTAALAKARVSAVVAMVSAFWLAIRYTAAKGRTTGRDRAHTTRVFVEYCGLRLTNDRPADPIATKPN